MKEALLENNKKSTLLDLLKYAALAIVIVLPFRIFIAQPYVVSGASMDPTFKNGDYLIVDQLSKRFELPERGSVLIIRYPLNPSKFFLKRLIAFPGETVQVKNGQVSIVNSLNPSGIELSEPYVSYGKSDNFTTKLGENEYFVMGDNRASSSDSRAWGPLPKENIIGEPIMRLLPVSALGLWPGSTEKEIEKNGK